MKIAILDLGTNTFHLLIAELNRTKNPAVLFKTRAVVKLGKNGFNKNRIPDSSFRKGIKTIQHFKDPIDQYKVKKVFAFATSAIRSSINGKEFVKEVKATTGITIKIISGDEEARLIYYGVRGCIPLNNETVLIMDIGGGSTEFILANNKKILWKQSFTIGVARLLEHFQVSDPIRSKDIKVIEKYLEKILQPLEKAISENPVTKLIGSSGSFETLAEMAGYRFGHIHTLRKKTSYQFDLKEYKTIHQWILKSTLKQRLNAKGLVKMRADMIVLSSICTNYILKKYRLNEMFLSKYALKEGALWELNGRLKH
jgi:exopolyphosphatase/guanosine-5'-triphosphate,3'-diphosphate pyrophosphatase